MIDNDTALAVLEATDRRRAERRRFLTLATSGAATLGGLGLLSACGKSGSSSGTATPTPTPTPTATSTATAQADIDILNFALNLEYLEAQFYLYAVYGTGLSGALTVGGGGAAAGTVTGGRQVAFTDPLVAQYAREIAQDKAAHVNFLRTALGTAAVAMPNINIDGSATGAFTAAALAAGVVAAGGTFDPYASDENFLLGAFIFEDVGVTAYKGATPLITSNVYLTAATGALAAEAYHAGLIRTVLYAKGLATPSLRTQAGQFSNWRDSLDGTSDDDQGVTGDATTSNIVPADGNGIAYSRTTGQVLNIAYLSKAAVVGGGFFPNGVNGNIKTSTAQP
ncbi:ferritin-like domain-containing protein [Sphingomonas bacterium]|uniref:ferritin-like domain-containing protein n=1 Tax=Sphingomonas bacterium TaxID=1895847 RepID=UPI002610EFAA|nr:ferritin-like domain-containing protein [Sphingomonas bacterium]MDB5677686.1 ferritin-like protein [Sphingomonas bacterium]